MFNQGGTIPAIGTGPDDMAPFIHNDYVIPKETQKRLEDMLKKQEAARVAHPPHYNQGQIEVIEFIEDQGFGEGFCMGNAIKYIARARHKGSTIEDLKKARWYLERHLEILESRRDGRKPVRPNEMNKGRYYPCMTCKGFKPDEELDHAGVCEPCNAAAKPDPTKGFDFD